MITAICILAGASLTFIFIGLIFKDSTRTTWHKKATSQPLSRMTFDDLVDEMNMIN